MCEASGPRACERTSSEQFRMQFDWVNVQQRLQTLQFQRCEYVAQHRGGELHATFVESSPSGSHTLPLALPFAAQPVACQCPGTVNTADANNLPKPHPDGPRGHAQARDDTTTLSTNFPAPASQIVTTQPTRFVHP